MKPVAFKHLSLSGQTGILANRITDNWLLGLRQNNPAIIDMFRDRDVLPYRDLLPWSGEFAGKYITGAAFTYKLTQRQDLYDAMVAFIDELLLHQDTDGYLGCFAKHCRLNGNFAHDPSRVKETWDSWNHYHIMFGLLLWYDLTGKEEYFHAVEKIAKLFMATFYDGKDPIVAIGSSEMNLAVYHVFGLLYERTKQPEYLTFAKKIELDLSHEDAGNYIEHSQKGLEYYQCPKPRWESMHIIMGIAQMYKNTGEKHYLAVADQIFHSVLRTDVHNTGAFSTDEQAIGHPYKNSNIETCCVIAYNALGIDLFALTGNLEIIDFLERSHYNAILGYNCPTGRWSTYNTPMDGTKCASLHSINFQCRPGSPELNCCSVNAPRGVANLTEWLLTEREGQIYVNLYEDMDAELSDGLKLSIRGNYPAQTSINIHIDSAGAERTIAFRIPAWSKQTRVICGDKIYQPEAGSYLVLTQVWSGDLRMELDGSIYTEAGHMDYEGKCSIYAGPVLFGLDFADNPGLNPEALPVIDQQELLRAIPQPTPDGGSVLRVSGLTLRDFYHLGTSGSEYRTWLSVK